MDDTGKWPLPGGFGLGERPAQAVSQAGGSMKALCRKTSCQQHQPCQHILLSSTLASPSGMFFLLFARLKSSMSPWMACVSPLQRATSSGRGRATATLTLLRKSSLWTTYRLDCCPSQPRGESAAPRIPLPVWCQLCAVL